MQQSDENCSFCNKSDTKLVTHSLCDWCLMHSECCAGESTPVDSTVEADQKFSCDMCSEEYPENELQQHQETCMPRLVLRCSLCYEDYLTEDSLWNHLIVHKIAYEERELYYLEKRVSYKIHTCVLCNDQRSYQESCYWEHVHEDHDGFYLQCADCGEQFRSQKRKAEHGLNICSFTEKNVALKADELEFDDGLANTSTDEQSSQKEQYGLSEKDLEVNQANQTILLDSDSDIEIIHDCNPADDNASNNMIDKESTVSSSEEMVQLYLKKCSNNQTDLTCTHCFKKYTTSAKLSQHVISSHLPTKCDICDLTLNGAYQVKYHKARKHAKQTYQCTECDRTYFVNYELQRHLISHQEKRYACELKGCTFKAKSKKALERHMNGFHREKSAANNNTRTKSRSIRTDCPICAVDCDDQQQVAQHVQELHKSIMCTTCRQILANADELNNHKCSTCPHCLKGCYSQGRLIAHIESYHEMIVCEVCGDSFPGKSKIWYHKLKAHSEPQLKCPQCSKRFHLKCEYTRHMSFCVKDESKFPCKLCGRRFESFHHVTTHLRSAHGVKRPQGISEDHKDLMPDEMTDVKQDQKIAATTLECTAKGEEMLIGVPMLNDQSEHTVDNDNTLKNVADKPHVKKAYRRCKKPGEGIPCKICGRRFSCRRYVRKHMYRAHPADGTKPLIKQVDDVASPYENCPFCNKRYKKAVIGRHIIKFHHTRACTVCKKAFISRAQLIYHMLIAHTEPKYKCIYCQETFHVKNTYVRHVATHEKHNT